MMDCQYVSRIGPYFDGEVDAAERQLIAAHLAGCAVCKNELAGLQKLSTRLAASHTPVLSLVFMRQLHEQVEVYTPTTVCAHGPGIFGGGGLFVPWGCRPLGFPNARSCSRAGHAVGNCRIGSAGNFNCL